MGRRRRHQLRTTHIRIPTQLTSFAKSTPQSQDLFNWQSSSFPSRTADFSNFKFSLMPDGSTYVTQK